MQFQQLVRQHYTKEKSVTFYANELKISTHKLNVATNEVLQITAKQYVVETILLEAKRYLKVTDLSVKEISNTLGFDEPTNFNKFFKRYTKLTPLEFINQSF